MKKELKQKKRFHAHIWARNHKYELETRAKSLPQARTFFAYQLADRLGSSRNIAYDYIDHSGEIWEHAYGSQFNRAAEKAKEAVQLSLF